MNEHLRLLVELQKLDSSILSLSRTVREIPGKISAVERPLREAEAGLLGRKNEYEAAEKKKREKERAVEETGDRIEKMRARSREIKDNKAYQAHLKEIEQAEKSRYEAEDEILELMESMEAEAEGVREAEAALGKQKELAAEMKKGLDAEVSEAEGRLRELKGKRAGLVSGLDGDAYDLYMDLLSSCEGLAVTEVKNEVCTGCNMHIMPQLYVELKKNAEISQCPQCRRILYYDEGAP